MLKSEVQVVLRNKSTNIPYECLGGNRYRNIVSGKEGEVSDEKAKEVFTISVPLSLACSVNPLVKKLINRLGLVIES